MRKFQGISALIRTFTIRLHAVIPETNRACWPKSGPNKRPPMEELERSMPYKTALLVNGGSLFTIMI